MKFLIQTILKEEINRLLVEKKSKFKKLKDNKVPLTPEEREEVKKRDAVWGNGNVAVWKSKNKNGEITYVSHTHRAYNTAKSLNAIINKFHNFVKTTA